MPNPIKVLSIGGGGIRGIIPAMVMPLINEQTKAMGISQYEPSTRSSSSGEDYTGLVIDARGLSVSPSIAPMILTGLDNRQVYGNMKISRDFAIQNGIAGYYKSIETAQKDVQRLGNNPMIIKGEKTAVNDHHIWINENDATKVYQADLKKGFLKECRVGIVVD